MNSSIVTLVILSCIVALVNAQCSCQTKPPIDVIYQGETCECGLGHKYPVQMEVPKITEHRDAHYDYGFTVERPQEAPAQIKYTFDFHMEKPKPIPAASLATYGFEVQNPVQEEIEVPKRYRFDYQVETPVVKSEPSNLQGLLAHVDRVVIQKQDCPEKTGCHCTSYKPTIDLLQRCPSHGHLYRYGGALFPSYPQRYTQVSSSAHHQTPVQVSTSSDRSKRDVTNTFPIQIQPMLPGLRPNNQIMKVTEDENQNRISEILKTNFGEDPNENIEELLRPKPLGLVKQLQNDVEKVEDSGDVTCKTSDFILKIKPKLQEARSNIRSQITKIVNKARLDTIRANHLIEKRSTETSSEASTESTESDPSEVFLGDFDGSYEPIWITATTENADASKENAEEPIENSVNDALSANEKSPSNIDRFRKHCERCGELARKFPCPSCGAYPSDVTHRQGNPTPHNHGHMEYNTQPRYISDQFDQRQDFGRNGKLAGSQQGVDVTVGNYHNEPAYGELDDILDKNSKTLYSQNRRVDEGHLVQPMDFAHTSDAIRFIQELTQRNNNQYNEDYYSNGNSYDVGASARSYPAKRSFNIVPLVEKDDGSVLVKISPTRPLTNSNKNWAKVNENSIVIPKSYDEDEKKSTSGLAENIFNKEKTTANFEKFVRDGKKYEILALSPNGSEEGSVGSEEDMEILKYIYVVNQKENQKQNINNDSINTEVDMET